MTKPVCLVRHGFYPHDMLVHREANALRDHGFDVEVICLRGQDQAATEIVDGVRVHRLPLTRKKGGIIRYLYEYLAFFVLAALKLTTRHLRRRYAFIQINTMPDFLVFATLIPRLLGASVTLQMYEPTPELWATRLGLTQKEEFEQASWRRRAFIKVLRWTEQACIRYAHAAFAVTQQLKDNFVAHGANPEKITVVLNVPDPLLFKTEQDRQDKTNADGQPSSENERFTLICHGAIEERYGHDNMLEAVAALKPSIPDLQLRITGLGSYLDEFLSRVKAMGLQEQVHYLGYVPLEQLVTELRRADAGIVAQKSSAYSNLVHTGKMYDYMAFKKPVIASRLRAVAAYFDEDSLAFFTPGDSEDLARAILELYRNPERRRSLVQHADRLYQQYRWQTQREHYLAAYDRLDKQQVKN